MIGHFGEYRIPILITVKHPRPITLHHDLKPIHQIPLADQRVDLGFSWMLFDREKRGKGGLFGWSRNV